MPTILVLINRTLAADLKAASILPLYYSDCPYFEAYFLYNNSDYPLDRSIATAIKVCCFNSDLHDGSKQQGWSQ